MVVEVSARRVLPESGDTVWLLLTSDRFGATSNQDRFRGYLSAGCLGAGGQTLWYFFMGIPLPGKTTLRIQWVGLPVNFGPQDKVDAIMFEALH